MDFTEIALIGCRSIGRPAGSLLNRPFARRIVKDDLGGSRMHSVGEARGFTPYLVGLAILAASFLVGFGVVTEPVKGAQQTSVLVFGNNDNGFEVDNTASTLRDFGLDVERATSLPANLSPFGSVWYVNAYSGLDQPSIDRLASFVAGGGSAYLTGERPCCEALNDSVEQILRRTLKDQNVQVGGLGDINGPFTFNTDVTDHVARFPNFLTDFVPDSPGGMAGLGNVSSRNVFASNGTTPVGAVWSERDMKSGKGRIALLMDIDWLGYSSRATTIENIQNFLVRGSSCSSSGAHSGMKWGASSRTSNPGNCSVLLDPSTITWSVSSNSGPVSLTVEPRGVNQNCSTPSRKGTTTSVKCSITSAVADARLQVTASDRKGKSVRVYRVRPKNDPANVPPGQKPDSNWWNWPDQDKDGIPDHWETNGVKVEDSWLSLPGADPRHKDLYLHYDAQEGEAIPQKSIDFMVDAMAKSPLTNPDGKPGVNLHVSRGWTQVPKSVIGDFRNLSNAAIQRVTTYSGFAPSPRFPKAGVPQIYKWMINVEDQTKQASTIGTAQLKGNFGWTGFSPRMTDAIWGLNSNPLMLANATEFGRASNAVHELGHMLGLHHHGKTPCIDPKMNAGNAGCRAADPAYKSVMSYSYSNWGIPPSGIGKNRIDYSREKKVNQDWNLGKDFGKLTFVVGQWGEKPNLYYANNGNPLADLGKPAKEPTVKELTESADPGSIDGATKSFEFDKRAKSPTVKSARAKVRAGKKVRVRLKVKSPGKGKVRLVIDKGPRKGSASSKGRTITYKAKRRAKGKDTLVVRAVNGTLGSRQVKVTIRIKPKKAKGRNRR